MTDYKQAALEFWERSYPGSGRPQLLSIWLRFVAECVENERGRLVRMDTGQIDVGAILAERNALRAKLEAAEERIADDDGAYRSVMAERCAGDELHCTCVPHLRQGIAELKAKLAECERERDEAIEGECARAVERDAAEARCAMLREALDRFSGTSTADDALAATDADSGEWLAKQRMAWAIEGGTMVVNWCHQHAELIPGNATSIVEREMKAHGHPCADVLAKVRAEERERCARHCDSLRTIKADAQECAISIRALGDEGAAGLDNWWCDANPIFVRAAAAWVSTWH